MAKGTIRGIVISEETEQYVHVPHPNSKSGAITLCGWVDVSYQDKILNERGNKKIVITCPRCLEIVYYCRRISFPFER